VLNCALIPSATVFGTHERLGNQSRWHMVDGRM
jgi:hypothetical protein